MIRGKYKLILILPILTSITGILLYMSLQKKTPATVQSTQASAIPSQDQQNLVHGSWQYMPGVTQEENGLLVHPTNFAIVEQNGMFAQSNPPANLAGVHIENVKGDFSIATNLDLQDSPTAILQFYAQAPIIADEFRIERKSIHIQIEKNKITISMWNGSTQTPIKKTYTTSPQTKINFVLTQQANKFQFICNGKQLGETPNNNIFTTGNIFFGLESQQGTWFLSQLKVNPLNTGTLQTFDTAFFTIQNHNPQGIQTLASQKRPGFIVGMAQAIGPAFTDPQYAQIAFDKNMFGGMTPENDMKMINLQPQKGIYTFQKADALVELAKQNGLQVHGHTLVFAEANPPWFNNLPVQTQQDKNEIERIMIDHITTVVKHFGNKIGSWDVINEPMADYDDTADGEGAQLRTHKWYQAMGESYITKALIAAHQANPNALLFINEYGLESDGDRWDAFIALLTRLKKELGTAGVPINKIGVGFQTHIYESEDRIDQQTLKQHIEQLAQLGIVSQISENDVYSTDGDNIQAQQYSNVFLSCLSEKSCIAWRGWILSDRYNFWKDDDGTIYPGKDGLFDTNMNPRPALNQIQSLLSQ